MPQVEIKWTPVPKTNNTYSTVYQQYVVYVYRSLSFKNRYVWLIVKNTESQEFVASYNKEGGKVGFSMLEGAGENAIVWLNNYIGQQEKKADHVIPMPKLRK